jgi:hypothetical protein
MCDLQRFPLALRGGTSAGSQVKASSAAPPTIAPTAVLTIRDATPNRGLGASLIQPMGVSSYRARAFLQAISPRARAVRTSATFSVAVPGKSQTSRPLTRCLSMASIFGPSSCLFIDATRTHATRRSHAALASSAIILRGNVRKEIAKSTIHTGVAFSRLADV